MTLNLKKLEQKAWMMAFEDGLWDIFFGALLMAMGVSAALGGLDLPEWQHMGIYIGIEAVIIGGFWAGKAIITRPRIGRVTYNEERRKKIVWTRVALLISVLAGLVMFFLAMWNNQAEQDLFNSILLYPIAWAVNAVFVFGLGAILLDFNRLFLIGFLYAMVLPLDAYLGAAYGAQLGPMIFMVAGAIPTVIGLVLLAKFMRTYPPLEVNTDGV